MDEPMFSDFLERYERHNQQGKARRTSRAPFSEIHRCLCAPQSAELRNGVSHLAKTHFDTRYQAFELFLEIPKGLKARKHVTSRIGTKEDVENVLMAIRQADEEEEIDKRHYLNYRAIVLLGAFAGQRPQATMARLSVGQFRKAIGQEKPLLDILPDQDKIRLQHYCPLHTQVVEATAPLFGERRDDEPMFNQLSFERWLEKQKVPLVHGSYHFVSGDLRKFCEQMGDILQWDQSNNNYILTHGVSGGVAVL